MSRENIIDYIADTCRKTGASGYEIFDETSKETFIKTSRGKLERISTQTEKGISVRVFAGKRAGSFYSSDLSHDVLEEQITRTYRITQQLDEDEGIQVPDPHNPGDADLDLYDETFERTPQDEKIDFVLRMESAATQVDPRIVTHFNLYQEVLRNVRIVNSNGFDHAYRGTYAYVYCAAVTKSEKVGTRIDCGDSSRYFRDIVSSNTGRRAAEKAVKLISDARIDTATMPVIFDPEMACDLIRFFSHALSAEAVQKKQSFLADKKGQRVGGSNVSFIDDGSLPGQMGTYPFDCESNPPVKNILVSAGQCQSYLYDEKTAVRDGIKSTGNAVRVSYRSPLSIQPTNFYIEPGETGPDDLIGDIDRGLYLYSMTDTGGVSIVSGDFSVEARGVLIEKGKKTTPLNNLVMSSTLPDILNNISGIANDFQWHGRFGAPTLLVRDMVIAS